MAKPKFSRYRDLTPDAINVEYQVHTNQTDGEATALDILCVAKAKGLGSIAFTEHVRKETSWFPQFRASVDQTAAGFPSLKTYVGCETKAIDTNGALDVTGEIIGACEIVLGSVHRFPNGKGGFHNFDALTPRDIAEMELQLSLGMIRNAPIDVLAHPGGMYQRRYGAYPDEFFREMMKASLAREIAIEINSSYLVDVPAFLRLCEEINPYVSIGSDAHKIEELGRCRDMLISLEVAKR